MIIVGAGPTGLMLAGELALANVDVMLVERRPDQVLHGARAMGFHARTLEVLEQRGIADRFLAEGETMQIVGFGGAKLDIGDFPSRHPYGLHLGQARVEAILAAWVEELSVPIQRGRSVAGVIQDDAGAVVELGDGSSLRASYVVGCDGGRSVVRKAAGIEFAGWDPSTSYMLAEVSMPDSPTMGFTVDEKGRHAIGPMDDGEHRVRLVVQEVPAKQDPEPTFEELRDGIVAVWGTDFGVHSPTQLSRFSDAARQATAYRAGRLFVAGDAAHVHSPMGGQGLNTGVQDAVNLGWKLAQVVHGTSPDGLLDSYHDERHPIGAWVLQSTLAQTAAARGDDRTESLRAMLADVLVMDEPRRHLGGLLSGLSLHYDLGDGHPLLGRRMPDLDLATADGPVRLSTLLHGARPLLLDLGDAGGFDLTPWGERIHLVSAQCEGAWELPVLGDVPAPAAVLVRPDGYVAWVGALGDPALPLALTRWFGAPSGGRQG